MYPLPPFGHSLLSHFSVHTRTIFQYVHCHLHQEETFTGLHPIGARTMKVVSFLFNTVSPFTTQINKADLPHP